jgi:hypothetical protein
MDEQAQEAKLIGVMSVLQQRLGRDHSITACNYCLQLLLVRSPQGPGERQEAQGHPSRIALRSASSSSACGRRLCCRSHRKGIDSTRCVKWRGFELLCIGVMSVLQQRLGR